MLLTAEGIYRHLLRRNLPPYELAQLQRVFPVDDHGLWAPEGQQDQKQQSRRDQKWQDLAEKTQTGLETVMSSRGTGGGDRAGAGAVANREDVDYRAFLRRFAVPREVMAVDGDAFDYIFYTYGLQLYGNMPLVEPPETRGGKRIEDFVIAVDTSMSTSGAPGAGVSGLHVCHFALHGDLHPEGEHPYFAVRRPVRADTVIHDWRN